MQNEEYAKKGDVRVKDKEVKPQKRRSRLFEIWRRLKKNKLAVAGLIFLLVVVAVAILAPIIAPYSPLQQDPSNAFAPSSLAHLLCTDKLGRDILSRLIFGARQSLLLGVVSIAIAAAIGIIIGVIAGFYGGWLDILLMRILDIYQSVPMFLLCVTLAAILGASLTNAIIAIGISNVPVYARITRATVLTVRQSEYVEAARAIDASTRRTIFVHILPNCLAPIIVEVTMGIASAVLAGAALSFIGLGVQPPTPEWGAMVSEGRNFMRQHPTIALYPGLCIMATVLSFNLLGDGLRDALDPRLKN